MARVTIEDCLDQIHNRFELVLVVAQRAQKLMDSGALSYVSSAEEEKSTDKPRDKPTVLALREIAAGHVQINSLGIAQVVRRVSESGSQ